jgi:hypothetical protein
MRNGSVTAPGGTVDPIVTVYLRDFCNNNASGAAVGTTTRVFGAGKLLGITQAQLLLALDCTVRVELPIRIARKSTYVATVELNTSAGSTARRTVTVVGR